MGTCFTEQIGGWLSRLKFEAVVNPFGISYNPISIANHLEDYLEKRNCLIEPIKNANGDFFHPEFHSSMNTAAADRFEIRSINNEIWSEMH